MKQIAIFLVYNEDSKAALKVASDIYSYYDTIPDWKGRFWNKNLYLEKVEANVKEGGFENFKVDVIPTILFVEIDEDKRTIVGQISGAEITMEIVDKKLKGLLTVVKIGGSNPPIASVSKSEFSNKSEKVGNFVLPIWAKQVAYGLMGLLGVSIILLMVRSIALSKTA